jgi:glycosyltransferase involved in cell wall biosynthesis
MQRVLNLVDELGLRDSVRIVEPMPYERMPEFYQCGHVLVSVPFSDGTPMSLLEGMACGCAPVVSDLPSVREWVREGWNGCLVAAKDASQIASAVLDLLTNPHRHREFAERNRALMIAKASQHASMTQMASLYASAIATVASTAVG